MLLNVLLFKVLLLKMPTSISLFATNTCTFEMIRKIKIKKILLFLLLQLN